MFQKLLTTFQTPVAAEPITDEQQVAKQYRYWRIRVMYGMLIGYAVFYFCRKNFSMANKAISDEFDLTTTQMGMILSVATILYAFSKFLSGVLADRMNARYLMGLGLILSAVMNVLFGLSPWLAASIGMTSPLILFITFWALSNLFQGTGVPPCSKLLTFWYSPSESGTAWGIWNSSHQIGGAIILILAGFLVSTYNWQAAFFVPAVIAMVTGLFIINRLRDTPESLGLPPIEVYRGDMSAEPEAELESRPPFSEVFRKHILTNRMIWLVCLGNFFVYVVRISVLDWGPRFLQESKGFSPEASGFATSGFELAGVAGALAAGWFSDKLFTGRRGPVMVVFMLLLMASIGGLLVVPTGSQWTCAGILIGIGFFVYGPQMLVAVAAADFATKEAAATAVGLTGFFGYMGATLSGVGTGWIVDNYGWNGAFWFFIVAAAIGTGLFVLTWNERSPMLEQIHQTTTGSTATTSDVELPAIVPTGSTPS